MNNSPLGALNALRGFPNLNFKIIAIIYSRGWDAFTFGNYSYSLLFRTKRPRRRGAGVETE